MRTRPLVPMYDLQERAKQNFEIIRLSESLDFAGRSEAHRDNNYMFIFQERGISKMVVDFQEITITGPAIFCILPGQIHYGISLQKADMWALAIGTDWIKDAFRTIVTEFAIRNVQVSIIESQVHLLRDSLVLLQQIERFTHTDIQGQTLPSMLEVCLSLFVSCCKYDDNVFPQTNLRPVTITRQFRNLLVVSFRQMKSPAEYAGALNISPPYLNEVVKNTTGQPVSYWIHQEIILEAKRMLFYTDNTVKEIAENLGYADVTYFIRLFGKVAGLAPLKFRNKYHK
ncbi:helix-turn-helix domain-containing protein [Pedobacter cryoconitis]|uniref:AraC-like DNA-binding protein n=1 Tax=Pedobacter cryoconitis TaxID=188932 RepID=A0A7X0J6I9_9SPHI|nr:helix-turn-helix domain-containing protein [Pedobacter cryoconitis]MBB6502018.1 AraC-like DNA-binding protein [Pedobacter cryoconitis]